MVSQAQHPTGDVDTVFQKALCLRAWCEEGVEVGPAFCVIGLLQPIEQTWGSWGHACGLRFRMRGGAGLLMHC